MIGKVLVTIVALMVAIIIGLLVFSEINDGISYNVDSGAQMDIAHDAQNQTNDTAVTIFTLMPIIGIVAIAGIILAIVTRFGGGGV